MNGKKAHNNVPIKMHFKANCKPQVQIKAVLP